MDAAIRWSPHSTDASPRFLVLDVGEQSLKYYELANPASWASNQKQSRYKLISQRKKLPSYTAFDWSKTDPNTIAIGASTGDIHLVQLASDTSDSIADDASPKKTFTNKHSRRCNSLAFSNNNQLAAGFDRVRSDASLALYDLNSNGASSGRLGIGEVVTSIKWFNNQPDLLLAGVRNSVCVRLYDTRVSEQAGPPIVFSTPCVHNIAIDPLDENFFISAGPSTNPNVSLWDRRFGSRVVGNAPLVDGSSNPVLEFKPGIDASQGAQIWSLRYSGYKRGCFGILSSSGEIKIVDTVEHSFSTLAPTVPANPLDTTDRGNVWSTHKHYVRATRHLQKSWSQDSSPARHGTSRIIAYDFMGPSTSSSAGYAIALRANKETIDVLKIPDTTPLVGLTAIDEMHILNDGAVGSYRPGTSTGTLAEGLDGLHLSKGHGTPRPGHSRSASGSDNQKKHPSIAPTQYDRPSLSVTLASSNKIPDLLGALSLQRRRCKEGYLFDFNRNKSIAGNDDGLVQLWSAAQTFDELATRDNLVSEELDLSYLGIADIWNNILGTTPYSDRNLNGEKITALRFMNAVKGVVQRWTAFSGTETRFPAHRQLCLAVCGWEYDRNKRRNSSINSLTRSSTRTEAYRTIVQAVFRGQRSAALDLFKTAVQYKIVDDISLGAVISSGEAVSEEQKGVCSWMAAQADEPYLRSLLTYFSTGDWSTVVDTSELALKDRVAVALSYLDDNKLDSFIQKTTTEVVSNGNVEGVILTGLSNTAISLFQNYVAKTGDIQTAVLALAPAATKFNPDPRFEYWKETYFMQMQGWKCFIERTRLITQLNRKAAAKPTGPTNKYKTLPVTLRCLHCQGSLSQQKSDLDKPKRLEGSFSSTKSVRDPTSTGIICPHCGRPMPRCGICMLWLGSPDPTRLPQTAANVVRSVDSKGHGREERKDPLEAQIMWCMKCLHGFHGHHAKEWFARHRVCAVPDCECVCGALH